MPQEQLPSSFESLPSSFIPEKSGDEGILDSVEKFITDLAQKHPVARERLQRFITGTSPESQQESVGFQLRQGLKPSDVATKISGPGLMEIPGVSKATDWL